MNKLRRGLLGTNKYYAAAAVFVLFMMMNASIGLAVDVTNTNDSGLGSLRSAIALTPAGGTINILVNGVITLTSGQLDINKNLAITGPGPANIAIDGNLAGRVFRISSAVVDISGIEIQDGLVSGAIESGGGIDQSGGSLTLRNVTVHHNTVTGGSILEGGGIHFYGDDLTLIDVTVASNSINRTGDGGILDGGGIYFYGTNLTIMNSTINANTATITGGGGIVDAGGIYFYGTNLTIMNSTIDANTATITGIGGIVDGGGIYCYINNNAILTNVTVSGNSVSIGAGGIVDGGGISVFGAIELINMTIYGNLSSGSGGGIYGSSITVKNSIIANNTGGNCSIAPTSNGNNIDSGNTCGLTSPGDLINTNPNLGPLQDNGGPTFTHAILFPSPAIDAGDNSAAPSTDQRGYARIWDGDGNGSAVVDIGAYEFNAPAPRCIGQLCYIPCIPPACPASHCDINVPGLAGCFDVGQMTYCGCPFTSCAPSSCTVFVPNL